MDPKRLIHHNYLAVIAFLVLTVAWLDQPPSIAYARANQSSLATLDSVTEKWQFPVEKPVHLVNGFRQPNSDYSAGHRGVDFATDLGQSILSPVTGLVGFAGTVVDREVITIVHEDGKKISFEPACSDLAIGTTVAQGQIIGWICEPDVTYKQHCQLQRCLHFSVRQSGNYLSPLALLGAVSASRLLAITP